MNTIDTKQLFTAYDIKIFFFFIDIKYQRWEKLHITAHNYSRECHVGTQDVAR